MKKFVAFILVIVLWGSITVPVIHAHCMDEVSIDGVFLCCYETDDWNSCDQHIPIDTTNDEILNNTFVSMGKVKKCASKILLGNFMEKDNKRILPVLWHIYRWWKKIIPPILSQNLRAYVREIKKRE